RIVRQRAPLPSIILNGPPGIGKTAIARAIADEMSFRFVRLSGVLDGVKELREIVTEAERHRQRSGVSTVALVDEIHRFNKAQQDAFLPHVESGLLVIIGQTTENVSFRLRNALLSRLRVIELHPLDDDSMVTILNRAMTDEKRGLGAQGISLADDARDAIVRLAMGDARRALTALEWGLRQAQAENLQQITRDAVERGFGNQPVRFDQDGDYHYDLISAFIKSLRGSDPEAALYYMIRSLDGGEDPLFLTRRMIIFASEDASCDPRALEIAINCDRAVERVGLPEGRIPMAQAAIYLACASKSNASYRALRKMEAVVAEHPSLEVPRRLRNAPTDLMRAMGNAEGYSYPHDSPGGFVPERYLPDELGNLRVYEPTDRGLDAQIRERLRHYQRLIEEARSGKG
ncbi:MAG: replication-associated recombination protein A, partial [Bdellovibrionales bacterium]|nr:replication-associated recombination protein A [Bdellovibrionales bacterium]